MRRITIVWTLLLVLLFIIGVTHGHAQISGAGSFGCNASPVTGTAWTSATALNTTQILQTGVAGTAVLVTLDQTSTITGGAITFLGDPGDGNFVALTAWQVTDPTSLGAQISLPYTLQASTNKVFLIYMGGMNRLQLKLSTAITGTATVTPFSTIVCYPLPVVNVGNTPNVSVTNTPSVNNTQQGTASQNIAQVGGSAVALGQTTMAGSIPVALASNQSAVPVSGTFWQATQPVSGTVTANAGTGTFAISATQLPAALDGSGFLKIHEQGTAAISASSLPLPTGAATSAKQPALGTAGTPSSDVISVQGITSMTALKVDGSGVTQPVSGTFWQATQPVSAASLPLPTGAATSAKQPALGTAGTPSADVITIQGAASMTAVKVDGSGVTQPISGTVTATQATGSNLHVQVDTAPTTAVSQNGTWTVQPGNTANTTPWLANPSPGTTATTSTSTFESDANTTSATVKASAGNVYGWYVYNPNASVCFLEFFNTTTPTLGTTVPILSLGIPATSGANVIAPVAVANFSTAIAVASTTASKGSTTCTTGMVVNVFYE